MKQIMENWQIRLKQKQCSQKEKNFLKITITSFEQQGSHLMTY